VKKTRTLHREREGLRHPKIQRPLKGCATRTSEGVSSKIETSAHENERIAGYALCATDLTENVLVYQLKSYKYLINLWKTSDTNRSNYRIM
jgi:hypothetical protein